MPPSTKDYVLAVLFVKYIPDKYGADPQRPVSGAQGARAGLSGVSGRADRAYEEGEEPRPQALQWRLYREELNHAPLTHEDWRY
jgi:hypothetical protein